MRFFLEIALIVSAVSSLKAHGAPIVCQNEMNTVLSQKGISTTISSRHPLSSSQYKAEKSRIIYQSQFIPGTPYLAASPYVHPERYDNQKIDLKRLAEKHAPFATDVLFNEVLNNGVKFDTIAQGQSDLFRAYIGNGKIQAYEILRIDVWRVLVFFDQSCRVSEVTIINPDRIVHEPKIGERIEIPFSSRICENSTGSKTEEEKQKCAFINKFKSIRTPRAIKNATPAVITPPEDDQLHE